LRPVVGTDHHARRGSYRSSPIIAICFMRRFSL
jgi:hypothetical protein